jgi:hypothetical protein
LDKLSVLFLLLRTVAHTPNPKEEDRENGT